MMTQQCNVSNLCPVSIGKAGSFRKGSYFLIARQVYGVNHNASFLIQKILFPFTTMPAIKNPAGWGRGQVL
jgi:hypothetical protein